MSIFWLVLTVLMVIIEACTTQLVSIWFAVGALSGCISALITEKIWIQVLVFVVVTVITLITTRPLAKRVNNKIKTHTNSDRNIGKTALVVSDINNTDSVGQVKVSGSIWSAKSADNSVILKDSEVVVKDIEGAKLVVELK
ncbi:MAG: NfeD family protein [Eubacteriales bacterium]|nr:NfeD family protein [Eubacteriales bacterium]